MSARVMRLRRKKKFDHAAALRAVRDYVGYTDETRLVAYALIALADENGESNANEETIALVANIIAHGAANGHHPVDLISRSRAEITKAVRG